MIPLKEAIADKHSKAEKMIFNQRMVKGELSIQEYILYLYQQVEIFHALETDTLPHPGLFRVRKITEDILELQKQVFPFIKEVTASTDKYSKYLLGLSDEDRLAHVYLNYLAILFGGQIIKKNIPGEGRMYDFDGDIKEIVGSIRQVQKDEWADEVNRGLDFHINILHELQQVSN